jgi:repressor LexA
MRSERDLNQKATITPKQKQILDFIGRFQDQRGYSPSQQEIAAHFGFRSLGTVQNYLVRLERLGLLQKSRHARRGMQMLSTPSISDSFSNTGQESGVVSLPLLGKVAAGCPIEEIENEKTFDVPASMIKAGGNHMVLKVSGDSMIEDGILEGDYVVVKKQNVAKNGQTVIARVGNEATLKRFYQKDQIIELRSANSSYQPMIIESLVETGEMAVFKENIESKGWLKRKLLSSEFKIEGILVGVIRQIE